MSLQLRRISLNNFRKFREPLTIEGLGEGLNIIIEPNESGKSTILEALRAAFFVRHATKNQLAQSFAPYGEAVAPEIEVSFDIGTESWKVAKRFLKGPQVEVTGPQGRAQGEDAENRLQALLGFVKDSSQRGDPTTYGALGLLWVPQAQALEVTAPGSIVRSSIQATLEAEVGTIVGGAAYERVRKRIDEQYDIYWTPTGKAQSKGRWQAARDRDQQARQTAADATKRLDALETSFGELEAARGRLKVIERELADETEQEQRAGLVQSLEIARAAAQILETRKAEHENFSANLDRLDDLQSQHEAAKEALTAAGKSLIAITADRDQLADQLEAGRTKVAEAKAALDKARDDRATARQALGEGEGRLARRQRHAAITDARQRHTELLDLELQLANARNQAAQVIPAEAFARLEANDRAVAEARAAVNAGATTIELTGDATGITINGEPLTPNSPRTLTGETQIALGGGILVIRPPATAASAEARLAELLERQELELAEWDVAGLAAARTRNDTARDAQGTVQLLETKIAGLTPTQPLLDLAAGPDALKLFVAGAPAESPAADEDEISTDQLTRRLEEAETVVVRAETLHDQAVQDLREIEDRDRPLAAAQAGAERDQTHASDRIAQLEGKPDFAGLADAIAKAREDVAQAAVKLAEAKRNATAHDVQAINRKIETIDSRARAGQTRRSDLEKDIARLEAIIESEGGKGLASLAAAAAEEADAATQALARLDEEAATVKMLKDVLDEARAEASRTFVGPVAQRARVHVERLFPGADLSFDEELGLASVTRSGLSEACGTLSKGTQEQLAVLTRLAFADMLLEQGTPVSLILDDPLVYSDDGRLDLMTEILEEASQRMQVILLTCRDRAFRHLSANRVQL
ncbi:AAA family ATPase (plasmid) [Sphingobium sp. JS3065]|uniref:AAA family ATPase n=1 Tax=Sphingobium sp. JS3065 TaxID=2970925 RepID=UPI0022653AEC|nr:AAA family ATPase [Sphingobium sp. JS3065]UZW58217.1 AAA family ATPase [Sphingobium sp. JS3065]